VAEGDFSATQSPGFLEECSAPQARAKKAWILAVFCTVRFGTELAADYLVGDAQ
jgi:hypothetical protein